MLENPTRPWKAAAFSQYPRSHDGRPIMGYSMRTERHRFTAGVDRNDHARINAIELYDHEVDPGENTNIAGRPETKALVEQLTAQWRAGWRGALPSTK